MRIYIAAPWADRELARVVAQAAEDRGIEITHKWWDVEGDFDDHEKMASCAAQDYYGVRDADFVLLLNTRLSEGKAVEQGLALAWDRPIVAIGNINETKNVFHHLEDYTWVEDPSQAFEELLRLWKERYGTIV